MSDHTPFRAGSRPRRRGLAIGLSVAAHLGILSALVVSAFWQVEKLESADAPLFVAAGPGAPLPSAGEETPEPDRPKKKKKRRARPDEIAQVERSAEEAEGEEEGEEEETGGGGDGEGDGTGGDGLGTGALPCGPGATCGSVLDDPICGDGETTGVEECDDGNRVGGDGCSARCKVDREHVVPSRLIEGSRIAGDPQIRAPDSVRQQMARAALKQVVGNVKMCLDRSGRVRSVSILKSTGFKEYDQLLLSRMRDWRYRPYRLDTGAAVPVCTAVTFIYRVQ
jgi:TonB family protein